jgi:anti-sigma factor RsiW
MRLTLRTLLAYLDDTLEPAATKEIGQKLAETPAAQELVSRIKEVTRRRRLAAPPVAGDDVDPNTLAEYLDNLLPSDTLAKLESLCLESDVHLAEASASHQILTLIGQPANVSEATRQRMYDLVQATESTPGDRRASARPSPAAIPLPSSFAGRPVLAKFWTAAAVLLFAAGAFLVWVSLDIKGRDESAKNDKQVVSAPSDSEPNGHFIPRTVSPETDEPSPPSLPPDAATATPEPTMPAEPDTKSESPPPITVKTEPTSDPDAPVKSEPTNSELAKPSATEPMPAESTKAKPAEPPKPEPAPPEPALATYASSSGVLLRADENGREWRRLSQKAEIKAKESVLCLPSFRAMVQQAAGPGVELVGETELALLPAEEGIDSHVRLDRGRIVLSTSAARATFQIDFRDQSWRIAMPGPELIVGFSLVPTWKPGGPFSYEAAILVPRGEVEVQTDKQALQIGGPAQLRWSSSTGLHDSEAISLPTAWLEKEEMTLLEVRASASLESPDTGLPFDGSIVRTLVDETTNERSKETRLLAIQGLAAIGRLSPLIEAMNTMGKRDVRQAAIASLRQYLARGEQQEEALGRALLAKFNQSKEYAGGVLSLLRGYSDADFKNMQKKEYEDLIDLLSADRDVSIRELAIMNLEDLAGKPMNVNYTPDKPRDADIAGWRRAIDDGRLPPKTRGKM